MSATWRDRFRYFRCNSILDGRCTCSDATCSKPGKHPKAKGWQQEALISTPEQVEAWKKDPKINLGLLCGAESDVFVLDIEHDGFDSLNSLTKKHEPLPTTLTVLTGGGGLHYYFKHPVGHVLQNAVKFLPQLDIRTTGGLVIAPGGRHKSGRMYEITIDREPAEAPTWLLDFIVAGQSKKKDNSPKNEKSVVLSRLPDVVPEGERDDTLYKYGCYLRGQCGKSSEEILDELRVANGQRCKPPLPDADVRKCAESAAKHEARVALDDSDQALTSGFADAKKEVLRYLTDDRSWWSFDSGLWLERTSGPVFETGEFIKSQEPAHSNKTLHKRLHSEKAVASVLRLAKDRPEFRAVASAFDHNPWLLGLPKGLALDLTTGEVRGARPDDLLTRALPVIPSDDEPERSCPRWLRYLEEAHPDDSELQAYLRRYAGYAATSSVREEQVLFLIGRPGAGKGTYTETLQAVLGPYYCQLPLDLLLEDAKEDRRLNHIAELRGKRLGVCNEGARSKKLDRNALKNLTGGGSVTGRRLGHQAFDFPMTTKILIVSNDEPVLDLDDAMKQRVHVVPFNVMFRGDTEKDDKGLKQFLKQREIAGIARWLVNGCVEWQRIGLQPPNSVVSRTQEYFANADLTDQFLQECCEFSAEFFTATIDLFNAAKQFCEDRGEKNAVTHSRLFVPELINRRPALRQDRPRGKGHSGKPGLWGIALNEEGRRLATRFAPRNSQIPF
jgi:putative DNA primase/helicase